MQWNIYQQSKVDLSGTNNRLIYFPCSLTDSPNAAGICRLFSYRPFTACLVCVCTLHLDCSLWPLHMRKTARCQPSWSVWVCCRATVSPVPARLSSRSVCLRFHNCWLPWSRRQWAPDARYQSQPGAVSHHGPQVPPSQSLLLARSGPSDLLSVLHSPVLDSDGWLQYSKSALPSSSNLNPQTLISLLCFPSAGTRKNRWSGKRRNATKLDCDYKLLPFMGKCKCTSAMLL